MVKLEGGSPIEFNTGNEGGGIGAVMLFDTASNVFKLQAIHQGFAYLPVSSTPPAATLTSARLTPILVT